MRYKSNVIKKDRNNVRYYKPRIVPNIPIKDSDIFIYPLYGDRFDTLAQRYYEDSNLWWIIAKANEIGNGKIALNIMNFLFTTSKNLNLIKSFVL